MRHGGQRVVHIPVEWSVAHSKIERGRENLLILPAPGSWLAFLVSENFILFRKSPIFDHWEAKFFQISQGSFEDVWEWPTSNPDIKNSSLKCDRIWLTDFQLLLDLDRWVFFWKRMFSLSLLTLFTPPYHCSQSIVFFILFLCGDDDEILFVINFQWFEKRISLI